MKQIETVDKAAILAVADQADKDAGLPRLEGVWGGGGVHVVGPDPTQPEKLWTLHLQDPVQTADGKTYAYPCAEDFKAAPAKCAIVERDPVKWAGATPLAVAVAEPIEDKPTDDGADMAPVKG